MEFKSREVRTSTKLKSLDTQEARSRDMALQKLKKSRYFRPMIKHQFEQSELLKECLETEIVNLKWLETQKQLAKEDDLLNERLTKQKLQTESIRHISKRGQCNIIVFPSTESIPSILTSDNHNIPTPHKTVSNDVVTS